MQQVGHVGRAGCITNALSGHLFECLFAKALSGRKISKLLNYFFVKFDDLLII